MDVYLFNNFAVVCTKIRTVEKKTIRFGIDNSDVVYKFIENISFARCMCVYKYIYAFNNKFRE